MQERARILTKWSQEVGKSSHDLAGLMCLESGKPRAEAKGEVNYTRSFIDLYAGMQPTGFVLQPQTDSHMLLATKEVRYETGSTGILLVSVVEIVCRASRVISFSAKSQEHNASHRAPYGPQRLV